MFCFEINIYDLFNSTVKLKKNNPGILKGNEF